MGVSFEDPEPVSASEGQLSVRVLSPHGVPPYLRDSSVVLLDPGLLARMMAVFHPPQPEEGLWLVRCVGVDQGIGAYAQACNPKENLMTNREFFLQRRSMECGMFEKVFNAVPGGESSPFLVETLYGS